MGERNSGAVTSEATGRERLFDKKRAVSSGLHPKRSSPLNMLRMLLVSTQLGSSKARAALTLILFLAIWLILSIPDAFAQSTITRESSFTYDSTSSLLLTETIEPNDANFTVTTTYTYDAYGNRLLTTTTGTGISTSTASAAYDAKGRFGVTGVNPLGHDESFITDSKFGQTTSHTGPNGLTATFTYDSFGRATLETSSDGNKTAFAYDYCTGFGGGTASCPSHGVYVVTSTPQNASGAQNGIWVKTYHDSHGRVIATDTQGFDGSIIRQATEYDALGRTLRESRPYFLSGGVAKWATYAYDALGRRTSVTLPDNSQSTFTFSGLTTSVTNDKNQTESTVKNARGEITSVTDANGKITTYTYDAFSNRTSITDSAGNIQTMAYDKTGRKFASVDPDLGSWTYTYNVLGELTSQTDAKGQTTSMTYDKLGRPLTRVEGGVTSTWVYDTATNGVSKLHTSATSAGYLRTHSYDSFGRPSSTTTTIDSVTETVSTLFNADGRLDRVTYPSGFAVEYVYTALGYENQLKEYGGSATVFWTADARDHELRLTQETAGNGVVTTRTFDQSRGFVTAVQAGPLNAVADLSYFFDTLGNLTSRVDADQTLTEDFTYDVLNRLKSYAIVGGATKTLTYDDLGNITSKSDIGTYAYAAAATPRPHAVASITGTQAATYVYDANGNMTSGAGRNITWTAFNKVASMAKGATSLSWDYGPERQRVKQTAPSGTTYYYGDLLGAFFEKHVGASVTQWNEYLFVGGEMVGVHFSRSDATQLTRYFVKDHLGSVAVLTDETGAVAERLSYDAWGKRRYPDGSDDPAGTITASTTRGFTGHEMIDDIDLVNMNGRVYDPAIGRFMSADPAIHDVTNSQDLNRYSYVHNNPLSYTDLNGYGFFKKLGRFFKRILKPLIAIVAALTLQFYVLPAALPGLASATIGQFAIGQAAIAGISSGVGNVILTGKPKSFLTGFGQGFATFGIGHGVFGKAASKFGSPGYFGKAVAHGVVGGAFSEIRGGSFASGFLAAGFSSAAAPISAQGNIWQGAAFSAAVGGTASVLGGGKFADGAATGAFGYLFNQVADPRERARRQAIRDANLALARLDQLDDAYNSGTVTTDQQDDIYILMDEYARVKGFEKGDIPLEELDQAVGALNAIGHARRVITNARDALLAGPTYSYGPCEGGGTDSIACVGGPNLPPNHIQFTPLFENSYNKPATLLHEGAHLGGSGESSAYAVECYVYCILNN